MKKRFLALFTTCAILTSFAINIVLATDNDVSGNQQTSGNTTIPSGDISEELSGDTSGESSGEKITITAQGDEFEIENSLRKKGVYTPARNILSNLISICEK